MRGKGYSAMKVPDLKGELSSRGLTVTGNKAELISRLQADDLKKSQEATSTTGTTATPTKTDREAGPAL